MSSVYALPIARRLRNACKKREAYEFDERLGTTAALNLPNLRERQ